MARAQLTVQNTARTGLVTSYTAAATDGHAFDNTNQNVILHVKNASASPITVTIDVATLVDGLAIADRTVSVAASAETFIGPFPKSLYNQDCAVPDIAEAVLVNVSSITSVTYAAIALGAL